MSDGEVRCRDCRFCHALPLPAPDPDGPLGSSPGLPGCLGLKPGRVYECRRSAPAFHPDRLYADWPCVKPEEDWCGEFRAAAPRRVPVEADRVGPGVLSGAPGSYWCPKCAGVHHPDVPCFDGGF